MGSTLRYKAAAFWKRSSESVSDHNAYIEDLTRHMVLFRFAHIVYNSPQGNIYIVYTAAYGGLFLPTKTLWILIKKISLQLFLFEFSKRGKCFFYVEKMRERLLFLFFFLFKHFCTILTCYMYA